MDDGRWTMDDGRWTMDNAICANRLSSIVYRLLCLAAVVLFALTACQPAVPAARKKLTIAWVTKSLGNPVFDLGRSGALQKAKGRLMSKYCWSGQSPPMRSSKRA
jgi:hypothetical protein